MLRPAGEEEAPEERLRVGPLQPGHRLHALEDAATLVQLDLLLREVRRLDAVAESDAPGCRGARAQHGLEQRRLSGPVRPDESHVLAALDRKAHVVEKRAGADLDVDATRLDDRASAARWLQELESEPAALPREQLDLGPRFASFFLEATDLR